MSGRMAMNTPWQIARIDREIYGEDTNTMTREEILLVSKSINEIDLSCLIDYVY